MAGLDFRASIDTGKWSRDVKKMRDDILSITKEGEKVDLNGIKEMISVQKDYVKDLEKQYKQLGDQISKLAPGMAQAKLIAEHKELGIQIEEETKQIKTLTEVYDSFAEEQVEVRLRQRQLRYELYEMALAGEDTGEKFNELTKELKELDSSVDSVKAMQNALRAGSPAMEAFTGSLRAGTGVFTAFTGVAGLFNAETERLNELQARLQSVMAISIGVEQTYQSLIKEGRLIQSVRIIQSRAMSKARQLETKNTIGATIAQRALNAVAKANPYVLLAGAIISVVGALALFTKRNKEALEQQKKLNESINNGVADSIVQYRLLQEEWDRTNGSMEKQKEFIENNQSAFSSLGVSIETVAEAESVFVKNTDTMISAMQARARATAFSELATEYYKEYLNQLDRQTEINNKLAERNLIAGVINGWKKKLNIDQPIDKAKKALDKFNEYIRESVSETGYADDILRIADIRVKAEDKVKEERAKKDKKEEKTFKQLLDARIALWEDYYNAIERIGRDRADNVFGDTLNTDGTLIGELRAQKEALEQLEKPTLEQVRNINLLADAIRDLTGEETVFEKQLNDIIKTSEGYDTLTGKIKFLSEEQAKLGETNIDLRLRVEIKKLLDASILERERLKEEILEANRTFKEDVENINKQRFDLLEIAKNADEIAKINEDADRKIAQSFEKHFGYVKDHLTAVFTDIDALTREQLEAFKNEFEKALKNTADLKEQEQLRKAIQLINDELKKVDTDPIKRLIKALNELDLKSGRAGEQLMGIGSGLSEISKSAGDVIYNISEMASDLGISLNNTFGDVLNHLGETLEGLSKFGDGVTEIGASLASGNPVGVVTGITKAVTGLVKAVGNWFNQDRKKERQMKQMEKEVRKLQSAYEDLQRVTEKALGNDEYAERIKMISNLRAQQAKLMVMADQERSKKKSDEGRIESFNEQYKELGRLIEDIIDGIGNKLLVTDVKSYADSLSDALVNAFKSGEDAVDSLNKAVDTLFENILKQALSARMQKQLESVFSEIERAMGFDSNTGVFRTLDGLPRDLSPEQMRRYRDRIKAIGEFNKGYLDAFQGLFEAEDIPEPDDVIEELKPKTLTGAIQGMSQETAEILSGQFNAIRIDVANIVSLMNQGDERFTQVVALLIGIKGDTANLNQMRRDLSDLNSKISNNDLRSSGL